ncbi:MAG: hypothetical protein WBA45_10440 [Microthrixaceae bacterium]
MRTVVRESREGRGSVVRRYKLNSWEGLSSSAAQFGVILVGVDYYFMKGGSIALLWAILLAPVCLPALHRYRLSRVIVVATPLTLVWGYVLALQATVDHSVDLANMQVIMGVVLTGIAALVLVLWARTFVSVNRVAILFGIGLLMRALMEGDFTWKFGLAMPVTFMVMGLMGQARNKVLPAVVILTMGAFGIVTGARSYFAFCFISAVLILWQSAPSRVREESAGGALRRWRPALLMLSLGLVVYFAISALLVNGAFGRNMQERSQAQVEASGSLIAGGRPEWAATRELARNRPHGFGAGVVPTWGDLEAGKAGLASINVDAGGYTKYYMFGGSFELHSVMADFWVSFGFAGLGLTFIVLFCLVRNVSTLVSMKLAAPIVLFSTLISLWSMFFGPMYTDWLPICVALGMSMLTRELRTGAGQLAPV